MMLPRLSHVVCATLRKAGGCAVVLNSALLASPLHEISPAYSTRFCEHRHPFPPNQNRVSSSEPTGPAGAACCVRGAVVATGSVAGCLAAETIVYTSAVGDYPLLDRPCGPIAWCPHSTHPCPKQSMCRACLLGAPRAGPRRRRNSYPFPAARRKDLFSTEISGHSTESSTAIPDRP